MTPSPTPRESAEREQIARIGVHISAIETAEGYFIPTEHVRLYFERSVAADLRFLLTRLRELENNLQRVTDHLDTWARDHMDEATTETWAALHCARATITPPMDTFT